MHISNDALFIARALLDLGIVLLAFRLGKEWLMMTIVINLILVSALGAKLVILFGFVTNVGNSFYAAAFLATHLLIEHYGEDEGYKTAWYGAAALGMFLLLMQLALRMQTAPATTQFDQAARSLFLFVPRIALASMAAYQSAQHLNVWVYATVRKLTAGKHLWLRDISSTVAGQALDSIIFFGIAFYGTVSQPVLLQILLIGFCTKVFIGILGTAFMYASYALKRPSPMNG